MPSLKSSVLRSQVCSLEFVFGRFADAVGEVTPYRDERYAYISTEMGGFAANILVTYDIRAPKKPQEASRWWLPGQNIAAGEKPNRHVGFDVLEFNGG